MSTTPSTPPPANDWISILSRANAGGQLDGLLARFAPLKDLYQQPIVQAGIGLLKNLFSK